MVFISDFSNMAGGKKKTKKNKGSKGKNGNGVKTVDKRIGDEGVEVGDIISLVDLHKEGHELNIVNGSDNNNENKTVETLKIDKKTKQTVSEESSPSKKDCSTTKAKEGDPEGIDISSLSLGIDPNEVIVLKEIFQGERK